MCFAGQVHEAALVANAGITRDGLVLRMSDQDFSDVVDANLTGADLSGANLTGVTWSNTTCPDGISSDSKGGTCETCREVVFNCDTT